MIQLMKRRLREHRTLGIILIWVAVFVAVFIVAWLVDDGDPLTDADEATVEGAGYLAAFLGLVLTGFWLVIASSYRPPLAPHRTCPSCRTKMQCDIRVCPACGAESQPWVRHHDTWWFPTPSGWQWVDEAGVWRWYRDGTPIRAGTTDTTPNLAINPAHVEPPAGHCDHELEPFLSKPA